MPNVDHYESVFKAASKTRFVYERFDIERAVLVTDLASDEAGWVTGQVLNVDGGVDVGTRPLWQYERKV